jgi:allantoicase
MWPGGPEAELLIRERVVYPDGALAEMVVWRLPSPVPPATHGFKYRLAYAVGGERIIDYDNERGKGDHRHFRGKETPYRFVSMGALLAEFVAEVNEERRSS